MCTDGSSLGDGAAHDDAHRGWSRRQFLRGLAMTGGAVTLGLNGIPVQAASDLRLLEALQASDPDRVLVLIQLAGGNDGLNTVIPITNDLYYQARPRIGIAATNTVGLTTDIGLHPSLARWEAPFKDGRLAIVQNVGYERPELSHFVSTDVWLSGDDARDQSGTGWLGRYLDETHPNFDTNPPDHPIAVQIGSGSPLLFQAASRSLGVNFPSPALLSRLTSGGSIYDEAGVPDSLLGEEMAFVRRISNNSFAYADAIKTSYDAGQNRQNYPGNTFAQNLATIARLIRGGLGSRIYHVTLGGFDTHANQAGGHSNLLRRLGDATAAFMDDLGADGLADQVMAMTFSEFGRRIRENSSSGTDHGTAAPLFVFGGGTTGGLLGQNPDLANLDSNANLIAQVDFRSVYAAVLANWFGMSPDSVTGLLGASYPELPLFGAATATVAQMSAPQRIRIEAVYPNPVRDRINVRFSVPESGQVRMEVVDLLGRTLGVFSEAWKPAGRHSLVVALPGSLAAGNYLLRLSVAGTAHSQPFVVVD